MDSIEASYHFFQSVKYFEYLATLSTHAVLWTIHRFQGYADYSNVMTGWHLEWNNAANIGDMKKWVGKFGKVPKFFQYFGFWKKKKKGSTYRIWHFSKYGNDFCLHKPVTSTVLTAQWRVYVGDIPFKCDSFLLSIVTKVYSLQDIFAISWNLHFG